MVPGSGCPHRAVGDSPQALIATPTSLMERVRHLFCADPEAVPHLAARLEGRRPLVLPLAAQVIPERVASFAERAPDLAFLWPWDMSSEHLHHVRVSEIFVSRSDMGP